MLDAHTDDDHLSLSKKKEMCMLSATTMTGLRSECNMFCDFRDFAITMKC